MLRYVLICSVAWIESCPKHRASWKASLTLALSPSSGRIVSRSSRSRDCDTIPVRQWGFHRGFNQQKCNYNGIFNKYLMMYKITHYMMIGWVRVRFYRPANFGVTYLRVSPYLKHVWISRRFLPAAPY